MKAAGVIAALALAGCVTPQPVPDHLTLSCRIAEPASRTVKEAVRVARERRASLEDCNAQLREILKDWQGEAMIELAAIAVALAALYVIGWRHGYASGATPRRRRTDSQ